MIIKLSSIQFKKTVIDYVKESLPWRVHYKKGVIVTAGSTQLALRRVFSTLHIGLFFPKVNETNKDEGANYGSMGFKLDKGDAMMQEFV